MIGPRLQPWQVAYAPAAEERVWLAREFDKPTGWSVDPHVPKRTCLGCGHSTAGNRWYVMCHGWGVEAWRGLEAAFADPSSGLRTEVFRLSWAEVARLRASEGVQTELFAGAAS